MSYNRAIVGCPKHLNSWASTPYMKNEMKEVKTKYQLNVSLYVPHGSKKKDAGNFVFEGPSSAKVRAAKNIIAMHMEQQDEVMTRERRVERAQESRDAALKEIEDGLRAEFYVPNNLIGLVIGKGGAHVNSVKENTGVERIVVDPEDGAVRIVGHDKADVARAREMLEYSMKTMAVSSEDVAVLLAPVRGGRGVELNKIRDHAGLVKAQLNDERDTLELIGTVVAVESALHLVETRLNYRKKINELKKKEDALHSEVNNIDYSYGFESRRGDFPELGNNNDRRRRGRNNNSNGGGRNPRAPQASNNSSFFNGPKQGNRGRNGRQEVRSGRAQPDRNGARAAPKKNDAPKVKKKPSTGSKVSARADALAKAAPGNKKTVPPQKTKAKKGAKGTPV